MTIRKTNFKLHLRYRLLERAAFLMGEKVLVKVSKDTGEALDKLILNDARPIYKVDEVENRVLYADSKKLMVFESKK